MTAVEWLVEKFNQCEPMYSGIQSLEHKQYLDGLIEQAKQMEKEQLHKCASFWRGKENEIEKPIFQQYYKETYGSESKSPKETTSNLPNVNSDDVIPSSPQFVKQTII